MISKQQAEELASTLIGDSKELRLTTESIVRRAPHSSWIAVLPVVILLPMSLSHWQNPQTEFISAMRGVLAVVLLMIVLLNIWVWAYRRSTPVLNIEHGILTYYGHAPWNKKQFNLIDISGITLSMTSTWWRAARLLSINLEHVERRIWLSDKHRSALPQIREVLHSTFGERYTESAL